MLAESEPTATLLDPALYVLATPIGNLGDITVRALATLRAARLIACEDTRVTRELLNHLGIRVPELVSVREHNERVQSERLLSRLEAGEGIVYASDAGTPAISDPGARLVAAVRAAGYAVVPIPGVSSVTAAMSVSGFEATAFCFLGFPPVATSAFDEWLDVIADRAQTSVFFESPHRAEKTLLRMSERLPAARKIVIARELTKKFETISEVRADALSAWVSANAERMRGEFVIIVEANREEQPPPSAFDAKTLMRALLEELPASKAAKVAAKLTGEPRQTLFELAESLKERG